MPQNITTHPGSPFAMGQSTADEVTLTHLLLIASMAFCSIANEGCEAAMDTTAFNAWANSAPRP